MKKLGEFKQPLSIEEFIGGTSHLSFSTKVARIQGKYLTGSDLETYTFELKLYEDGSCDFYCVDDNISISKNRREDLLETIKYQNQVFVNLRNKKIITDLPFTCEFEGKPIKVYLSISSQKPIDKLTEILKEEITIEKSLIDKISDLFGDESHEKEDPWQEEENIIEEPLVNSQDTILPTTGSLLIQKFVELKEQKLNDLRGTLLTIDEERKKTLTKITTDQAYLKNLELKIESLNSRISDLEHTENSLDYYFWVSPVCNKQFSTEQYNQELYEKVVDDVLEKLSKFLPLSTDLEGIKELLKTGYYIVKFGREDQTGTIIEIPYEEIPKEILLHIPDFIHKDEKIIYPGTKSWSWVCNRLIKIGFKQSATFNHQLDKNQKNDTLN